MPEQDQGAVLLNIGNMIDLAIGTPEVGTVDFNMLQAVLHCLAQQLRILDKNVELRSGSSIPLANYPADLVQTFNVKEFIFDTEDNAADPNKPTLVKKSPSGIGEVAPPDQDTLLVVERVKKSASVIKYGKIEGSGKMPEAAASQVQPGAPQVQPGAPQGQPGAPQGQPGAPQGQPGAPQGQPGAPQVQPGAPQGQPGAPQGQPGAPQGQPGAPQGQPGAPQGQPGAPQGQPGAPQGQPGAPQGQPGAPQAQPGAPQAQPGAPQAQPGAPQAQPGAPQAQPGAPQGQPVAPQVLPVAYQGQPVLPVAPGGGPVEVLERVSLVTASKFNILQSVVEDLKDRVYGSIPKNEDILQEVRSSSNLKAITDMWTNLNVSSRLEAAETGLGKISSLVQDLIAQTHGLQTPLVSKGEAAGAPEYAGAGIPGPVDMTAIQDSINQIRADVDDLMNNYYDMLDAETAEGGGVAGGVARGRSETAEGGGVARGKPETAEGGGVARGRSETAEGGGIARGKPETAEGGGVARGRSETAEGGGVARGRSETAEGGGVARGRSETAEGGGVARGISETAKGGGVARGRSETAEGGGVARGRSETAEGGGVARGRSETAEGGGVARGISETEEGGGVARGISETAEGGGVARGKYETARGGGVARGRSETAEGGGVARGRASQVRQRPQVPGVSSGSGDLGPLIQRLDDLEKRLKECCESMKKGGGLVSDQLSSFQDQLDQQHKDVGMLTNELSTGKISPDLIKDLQGLMELFQTVRDMQEKLNKVHETALQLAAEKEGRHAHMNALLEQIELLKIVKLDREDMVEAMADKADLRMLARKVSHDQFELACDDLSRGLEHAIGKLGMQETLWQQALDDIQREIETKLDKMELSPVKDFFNQKLRQLQENLKAIAAMRKEVEAAGTKRKLLRDVNCISCDAQAVMPMESNVIPAAKPLQPTMSMKPYLTYELDTIRKQQAAGGTQQRNMNDWEAIDKQMGQAKPSGGRVRSATDKHLCNRYCGGSHTVTTPAQRVARTGHFIKQWGPEVLPLSSGFAAGDDGRLYKVSVEAEKAAGPGGPPECTPRKSDARKSDAKPLGKPIGISAECRCLEGDNKPAK